MQLSILEALESFVKKTPTEMLSKRSFDGIVAALVICLGDMKYTAVRTAAMKVLVTTVAKAEGEFWGEQALS